MLERMPTPDETQRIQDPSMAEEAAYAEKPHQEKRRLFGMLGPSKTNLQEGEKAAEAAIENFEAEFYPGKSSASGFLAPGEHLNEIIARDKATCERLGFTPKKIGEAIELLLKEGGGVTFTVRKESYRGKQESPFDGKEYPFSNVDFTITNNETGESFSGPGLIVHLLKDHSFFEGSVRHRVNPEKAIKVLFGKVST